MPKRDPIKTLLENNECGMEDIVEAIYKQRDVLEQIHKDLQQIKIELTIQRRGNV